MTRIAIFKIPAHGGSEDEESLNRHLSSTRILNLEKHFVADGENSFWSICVTSQTGPARGQKAPPTKKPAIDYRDVLSVDDFAVFAKLRTLRKELAEREAVPPYAVFTNEQLAAIAQQRVNSLSALKAIEGVGDARVDKYGLSVTTLMNTLMRPNEDMAI